MQYKKLQDDTILGDGKTALSLSSYLPLLYFRSLQPLFPSLFIHYSFIIFLHSVHRCSLPAVSRIILPSAAAVSPNTFTSVLMQAPSSVVFFVLTGQRKLVYKLLYNKVGGLLLLKEFAFVHTCVSNILRSDQLFSLGFFLRTHCYHYLSSEQRSKMYAPVILLTTKYPYKFSIIPVVL